MDSVVLLHCDDEERFKTLQVLQFLPPCEVGAALFFGNDTIADEENDMDALESYVKCMKTQTRLARNYSREFPDHQRKNALKSRSCKHLLEENEKLKSQFKWVYFKDITQYLIPFTAVIGTLMLTSFIGTIWDCFHKKKNYECATNRGNHVK